MSLSALLHTLSLSEALGALDLQALEALVAPASLRGCNTSNVV